MAEPIPKRVPSPLPDPHMDLISGCGSPKQARGAGPLSAPPPPAINRDVMRECGLKPHLPPNVTCHFHCLLSPQAAKALTKMGGCPQPLRQFHSRAKSCSESRLWVRLRFFSLPPPSQRNDQERRVADHSAGTRCKHPTVQRHDDWDWALRLGPAPKFAVTWVLRRDDQGQRKPT